MNAIETRYNGYRFRSRLEARWAVFFDAMKWAWRYEAETYNVPGIGWYLPDFVLESGPIGLYEVKPVLPTEGEMQRAGAVHATILAGEPFATPSDSWPLNGVFSYIALKPDGKYWDAVVFCECRYCSKEWWMGPSAYHEFLIPGANDWRDCSEHAFGRCPCNDKEDDLAMSTFLLAAYKLARSARFEKGETFESVVDVGLEAYRTCRKLA